MREHKGKRETCPGCKGDRDEKGVVRTANLLVEHLIVAESKKLNAKGQVDWG
jgi:hypothetical protein